MKIFKFLKLRKFLIVNYVFLLWISYNRLWLPKFQGRIKAFNLILSIELTKVTKYNELEKVLIWDLNSVPPRFFPTPPTSK
jgi:hypothetical protein